jgi:hypothetical protein
VELDWYITGIISTQENPLTVLIRWSSRLRGQNGGKPKWERHGIGGVLECSGFLSFGPDDSASVRNLTVLPTEFGTF